MKPQGILIVGAVLLGLAVGYGVGKFSGAAKTPLAVSNTTGTAPHARAGFAFGKTAGSNTAAAAHTELATLESELRRISSGPSRKRWEALQTLARSISAADAPKALQIADKVLGRNEYWNFRYYLLQHWAEQDPMAVLAYGESLKNRQERTQAITQALSEWARKDPNAALAYVEKTVMGSERQQFYAAALRGVAESDPQKALELLNQIPPYQRRFVRGEVINALAESDPKAAAEISLKQFSSDRYGNDDGRLGVVLQKWMRSDPDAAVAWLASQPENVRRRQSTIRGIEQMSWDQPDAAVRLVDLIPTGQARENTLRNLLSNWAQKDLDAVQSWSTSAAILRNGSWASSLTRKDSLTPIRPKPPRVSRD